MTLAFNTSGIKEFIDEIRNFKTNLIQFDMDRVQRESSKRFAIEMTDMVTRTLIAHPDINAPATTGPFEHGPGPSMASKNAWIVHKVGNDYTVRPHPEVEQRAIVLNDGYGRITPNGDKPMTFTINGVPISKWEVEGPKATQYWQTAFSRLLQSDKLEEIAIDELNKEAERAFKDTSVIG